MMGQNVEPNHSMTRQNLLSNRSYKTPFFSTLVIILLLTGLAAAQEPYYYHTISSRSISALGGRTAKINFMYQLSHSRQFKLSALYIYDSYSQDRNEIKSDIWNLNLHFQWTLMNQGKFFLNWALGGGTYYFTATDKLGIKLTEWHVDFVTGFQAEFYLVKNTIALTVDYDIIFMPWSDIYQFLHVPNAGLTFFFF
jgi:hypothetical protein